MSNLVFELCPKRGALPIQLGISRQQIRTGMQNIGLSLTASNDGLDYYFSNSIQVEFDDNDCSSFIGIACDENIELIFMKHDLFRMSAMKVFELLSKFEEGDPVEFDGQECLFPKQILTLWDADDQYDWYTNYSTATWGQIGIGNDSYLSQIST